MRFVLIGSEGRVELAHGRKVVVGSAAECELMVPSAERAHVRIETESFGDSTHFVIEASAPCRVGKVPLAAGERRLLVPWCAMEVGGEELRLEEHPPSTVPTRDLALEALKGQREPTVVIAQGPAIGAELELARESSMMIGRSTACDLDLGPDDAASRMHAQIFRRGEKVLVRDLGSAGGTFMGRARLERDRDVEWPSERMLRVGRSVLALRIPWWQRGEDAFGGASMNDVPDPEASKDVRHESPAAIETAAGNLDGSEVMTGGPSGGMASVTAREPVLANGKRRFAAYVFVVILVMLLVLALALLVALLFV